MRNKILIAAFLLMSSVSAWAEGSFIYGNLKYTVIDSVNRYVSVSKGETELKGELNIPATATNNNTLYMVTTIDKYAFYGCGELTSVTIPNSVTIIDDAAFCNSGLTTITIPESAIIGSGVFGGCRSLTEINSDNPHYISENGILFIDDKRTIFCYPPGRTETTYTIPNSVERIYEFAFQGCHNLKSLTIPNSVTTIMTNAFVGGIDVEILEYNTDAIYDSWIHSDNSLKTVVIGDAVTYIDNESFYECSSLTSVTIGDGVTYIGDEAFEYCSSLTSVTIGESVKKIGDLAFYGCVSLGSVNIPNSVTDIGEDAFGGVKNINYSGSATGSPWSAFCLNGTIDGDFIYADAEKTKLAVYIGSGTDVVVPDNVTSIGNWAFRGIINSIIIPNSVKEIESRAFSGCDATIYLLCTKEEWTTSFDWYLNYRDYDEKIVWGYTPTPVTETAANAVSIYAYSRNIVVENAAEEIRVYDAMGRLVCRDAINHVRTEICVNNPGLYIVKVGNVAKRMVVR